MNETAEIMSTTDTTVELKPKTSEPIGRSASIQDVKPPHYDVPEGPAGAAILAGLKRDKGVSIDPDRESPEETPDGVRKELQELDGKENAGKKDTVKYGKEKTEPKDETESKDKEKTEKNEEELDEIDLLLKKERLEDAEKTDEKLHEELEELLAEYEASIADDDDENLSEAAMQKKKQAKKEPKMTVDIAAEIKKSLLVAWSEIKKMLFQSFSSSDKPSEKVVSGEEYGLSDEPFEGEANEREALRRGLRKNPWKKLVEGFRKKRGTQQEISKEASKTLLAEKSYKMEKEPGQEVEDIFTKNKLLRGRIANKKAELFKRTKAKALATKKAA